MRYVYRYAGLSGGTSLFDVTGYEVKLSYVNQMTKISDRMGGIYMNEGLRESWQAADDLMLTSGKNTFIMRLCFE